MNRTRYIVAYDIAHPKRLRLTAKICESFGTRIQYSVFECPLTGIQLQEMKAALDRTIKDNEDQVLFISLGPETSQTAFRIEALGKPYHERSRVTII